MTEFRLFPDSPRSSATLGRATSGNAQAEPTSANLSRKVRQPASRSWALPALRVAARGRRSRGSRARPDGPFPTSADSMHGARAASPTRSARRPGRSGLAVTAAPLAVPAVPLQAPPEAWAQCLEALRGRSLHPLPIRLHTRTLHPSYTQSSRRRTNKASARWPQRAMCVRPDRETPASKGPH
jgi:hypothetical protein